MTVFFLTLRGTLGGAALQEIFVHTMAAQSSLPALTVAQDLATEWTKTWNVGPPAPLRDSFPTMVVYNECTVAEVLNMEPPDPRLAHATHVALGPLAGANISGPTPSQCSVAVSVTAGTRPNGVPAKGRFYLPCPAKGLLSISDGLLESQHPLTIRDCLADFWARMNAKGHRPSLWSRRYGTIHEWDSIRVGNRVDTIRRRRNELPEVYTQAVTVP